MASRARTTPSSPTARPSRSHTTPELREISSDALFGRWLRAQGLRLTPHRKAVVHALRISPAPLSAEELHRKVPQAHLVTLYRTLDMLFRANIVRSIGLDQERAHFELAFDHHHHIVCVSCERIEDVHVKDKKLEKEALAVSDKFRRITNHSLEFFGLCNTCA